MKQYLGVWLPDHEEHLQGHMSQGPWGRGVYQIRKLEAAMALGPKRRVAVDIGAHVGLWSHPLSHLFTWVECFEPMPEHQECWRQNMIQRHNATLHPVAVGAYASPVRMVQPRGNTGNSHVVGVYGDPTPDSVPMVTLDSFALPHVDFIKIDCEGYEVNVLRGAMQTIIDNRPVIIVEQKPRNGQKYGFRETEAVELLMSWGGVVETVLHGDYIVRFP